MQSILLPRGISLGVSFDGIHAILSNYCTRMNPKAEMTESRAISVIGERESVMGKQTKGERLKLEIRKSESEVAVKC